MGYLHDQMFNNMKTNGYAVKTIKLYTDCVRLFAFHFMKSPLIITKNEVESFFNYLRNSNKSESTIHIYYESIKYFYKMHNICNRLPYIRFRHINNKLPEILCQNDVQLLLANCNSLKYKTIFTLIYSAGLRVSEASNLKLADIDFKRKLLLIRSSKNMKDRYTLLADETISLLNMYFKVYKPIEYVFYANDMTKHISIDCIQKYFHKYSIEILNNSKAHIHTLRHCFATHLLENGTNIFYIMQLLGHSSIQTTIKYLHIQELTSLGIKSPVDCFSNNVGCANSSIQKDLFMKSA